jgi:hypothetical protein
VISKATYGALLLLALSGCDDPLKPVDIVAEPRVLGARIEVDGDPSRASPSPGETVHVTWLVAAPNGDPLSGFGLAACSSAARGHGLSACQGEPFALAGAEPTSDRPRFDFTVPAELDAEAHPLLAVVGSLCPEASGSFDQDGAHCDGSTELAVNVDFLLATPDDINQSPNFEPDSLRLDGAPWPLAPAVAEPCQGLGLPELSYTTSEHTIDVGLPDSARQTLVQKSSADPARESLQVAHFASAGDLSSAFSQLLAADPATSVSFRWAAPSDAPAGGKVVRFWFVARDGRGGSDFTERALCALP